MEKVVIESRRRWDLGKNGSRRLRREGWVPAIVYGHGEDPVPVAVIRKELDRLLHQPGGRNHIYQINLDEKNRKDVLIKDFQLDPVRDELTHIDFIMVGKKQIVEVKVPLELEGVPLGVKNAGGILVPLHRELSVECLPQDIPDSLVLDVSALELNDHLKVKDIPVSKKVRILLDGEITVVAVEPTRTAVSKATAETEAEEAEAEAES